MRIGSVDLDTSHPQNWIPLERELGHEVTGIWDGGRYIRPPMSRNLPANTKSRESMKAWKKWPMTWIAPYSIAVIGIPAPNGRGPSWRRARRS